MELSVEVGVGITGLELNVFVPAIVWFPEVYTPFVTVAALPFMLPDIVLEKVFVPLMVSLPLVWTTALSAALLLICVWIELVTPEIYPNSVAVTEDAAILPFAFDTNARLAVTSA